MTLRQLLFLSITLLLASCSKEGSLPSDNQADDTPMLEMQWATRMELDREIAKANDVKEYGDFVINTGEGTSGLSTFYFFNKIDGSLIEQITLGETDGVKGISHSLVFNNIYIAQGKGFLAFDLETRTPIWKRDYAQSGGQYGKIQKIGDRLFLQSLTTEGGEIYEVNIQDGSLTSFFKKDSLYSFSAIALHNNVAYFNHYEDPLLPPEQKAQDLIAFDINTNKILWKVDSLSNFYGCNISLPPVIYDDLVITGGDWSIYAFDIHTGEQVWSTEIAPDHGKGVFDKTHHLLHNDRLYVNEAGDKLACLDARTGDIIWINDEAPNCSRHMLYNEEHDLLIMSSWGKGSILIFDALTGELLHTERGFENSSHTDDVIYDPESDLYFADTYKHTMAFKLNYPK